MTIGRRERSGRDRHTTTDSDRGGDADADAPPDADSWRRVVWSGVAVAAEALSGQAADADPDAARMVDAATHMRQMRLWRAISRPELASQTNQQLDSEATRMCQPEID